MRNLFLFPLFLLYRRFLGRCLGRFLHGCFWRRSFWLSSQSLRILVDDDLLCVIDAQCSQFIGAVFGSVRIQSCFVGILAELNDRTPPGILDRNLFFGPLPDIAIRFFLYFWRSVHRSLFASGYQNHRLLAHDEHIVPFDEGTKPSLALVIGFGRRNRSVRLRSSWLR